MKPHILVIDDERQICELLTEFFHKRGYDVSTASAAEEAQRLVAEQAFQLVILDVALEDIDGLELLGTLKALQPQLPIVMLTGMGFDDELLQDALQKGAAGYVSKTVPLDQLLAVVQRTLEQAHA